MFLDTLLIWEAAAEMTTAIFCFVLNIYFIWRFAKLSVFNRNLRVILVFEHLVTAILTLVHPILVQIPPHVYSLENGRYIAGAIVYTLFLLIQISVYLLVSKFALVAIERRCAFNNRRCYENSNSSTAWRIIKIAVSKICDCDYSLKYWKKRMSLQILISILIILTKIALCCLLSPEFSIDERLLRALNIDYTIWGLPIVQTIAVSSLIYSIVVSMLRQTFNLQNQLAFLKEFRRLKRQLKSRYITSTTLSERFQLKEIETVLMALTPIMRAFFLLIPIVSAVDIAAFYLHLVKHEPLGTPLMQALYNVQYWVYLYANLSCLFAGLIHCFWRL